MLMRILVQDGVMRMIGIRQGLLLGVGRIGLAAGSVRDYYQDEGGIWREERTKTYRWIPGHTSWTSLYRRIDPIRPSH
jgi:hypothetical protein